MNGAIMNKNTSIAKTALIGFVVGLVNGVFGSGGGTILVPCLVFLMGIEDHKAHATAISIILPISLISSFIYFRYDVVDLQLTLKVAIGSVIGALTGSCILNRFSVNSLRKIFGIFMIIAALRMVL
jgi:uncharacterized membrane protein YfcA